MQNISLGKLLYAYFILGIKFPENLFLDQKIKDFVQALYLIDAKKIGNVDVWNGIQVQPCTEYGIKNEVYSTYFRYAINRLQVELIKHLERADWYELVKYFPEVAGSVNLSTKITKASELEIKIPEFKSFFPEWDQAFYGLMPEDFIVLYSLAKRGKSSVSSYIAAQALKQGKTVAFYPTELTVDKAICSIYGFTLSPTPLRPDESIHYFKKNPKKLKEIHEQLGNRLIIPESNIFDWASYEEMYKQKPDFVILDQMSVAMSALGMQDTDAKNAGTFSKQLLTMKLKYMIPTLIVMQEGYRPPTAEERKKYLKADRMEFGTGNPRGTMSPRQDATLVLNLVHDPDSKERSLIVKDDRERNLTSGEVNVEILLDNRGRFRVGRLGKDKDLESLYPENHSDFTGEEQNDFYQEI